MPIFTIPLPQQNQAASAGVAMYPYLSQIRQYGTIIDMFDRLTMNPTNAIALYVKTNGAGTGTAGISGGRLQLTTTAGGLDDVDVTLTEQGFSRVSYYVDLRNQLTFQIIFGGLSAATTNSGFVGITFSSTALAALPTTAKHMGVFWNTAGAGTYILSSADGASQVTTDSLRSIDTGDYRLEIIWTADSTAVINLYRGTGFATLVKSQTVSALSPTNSQSPSFIHFYMLNNAAAARTLNIYEWAVSSQ